MVIKPTEGATARRQLPSVGRSPKGLWVAQAIAGGELLRSPSATYKGGEMEMEWIILSGSIIVAAYFIYSAIQRNSDINEKQLAQSQHEVETDAEHDKQLLSNIGEGLEWDIIRAKFDLEEAQKAGDKELVKKAKDVLKYKQSEYLKSKLAWFGAYQATQKKENKHEK